MPTVFELLSLPYNGVTLPPGEKPTVSELLELDYATAPFAQGILSSDYRFAFYSSPMARQFSLRRPIGTGERSLYQAITTTAGGAPLTEARCLVWETTRRVQDAEFGWISVRETMFSVLPEDVLMYPGWQVCLEETPEPNVSHLARSGSTSTLPEQPVEAVTAILTAAGALVSPSTYTVSSAGLTWLAGAPADGTRLTVEYLSPPWYRWEADEQGVMQKGADGLLLPQIGRLSKVSAQ